MSKKSYGCEMGLFTTIIEIVFAIEVIISISTILLNGCFIVALVKKSSLHTPSNTILGCLCCNDLLIGIFSFPYLIAFHYADSRDVYIILATVLTALIGLSSLFIVLVNLDRYFAICHPYWYLQYATIKRYSIVSVSMLLLYSVCITISVMLDKGYTKTSRLVIYSSIYIATILILMYCNWKILRVISRHRREVDSIERHGGSHGGEIHDSDTARYHVVIALVIMYFCYKMPGIILYIFVSRTRFKMSLYVLGLVFEFLSLLNCALNPILYCFRIRVLRDAVKEVLLCQRHG